MVKFFLSKNGSFKNINILKQDTHFVTVKYKLGHMPSMVHDCPVRTATVNINSITK